MNTILFTLLLTLSLTLLVFTMIFHEFIHWLTLKKLGYHGKLVTTQNFNKKWLPSIGIKPQGIRYNIIGARDIQIVLYAPLLPTMFLFIICLSIPGLRVTPYAVSMGMICGLTASVADLYYIHKIRKYWNPKKTRKF